MSVNVEWVCAGADRVCIVNTDNAVEAEGRMFCGDGCSRQR